MDLREPPDAAPFRASVRAFLAEHLPADWSGLGALSPEEHERFTWWWRGVLAERRYLAVSWPEEYGGAGLTPLESVVLAEEFTRAGVPSGTANDGFGIRLLGNTLLRWGTDEQRRRLLPRILSGEDRWCQGYSEPDAGSDLANLGCRAVLDGDEWVIDGQKIWTTAAHTANWIFLLARTNPTAPKHKGITFLLCPLDQPGIEIRPIRMMSGGSDFNEVFFSGARTPRDHVVGPVDGGWSVAMTLLGHERGSAAATLHVGYRVELDRLLALVREAGLDRDPIVRQRLAWCHTQVEIMRWSGLRVLTSFLRGQEPGPEASIAKLQWSEYHRVVTELAVDVLGAEALVPSGRRPMSPLGPDAPGAPNSSASWTDVFLNARAGTLYQGTSEVQRTILGERALGLPREPRADEGSWEAARRPAPAGAG